MFFNLNKKSFFSNFIFNCIKLRKFKITCKELLIEKEMINLRLDQCIKQKLDIKYSNIQKLIRKKLIYITNSENNKITSINYKIQPNDKIIYPETLKLLINPQNNFLLNEYKSNFVKKMIIFEDSNFLILNKFSNIASQGGFDKNKNLLSLLQHYYKNDLNLSIIHRLDKNTTGALIIGKNKEAARKMSLIFSEKSEIEKYYIAFLVGIPECFHKKGIFQGKIDLPLIFDTNKGKTKIANLNNNEKKDSVTLFEILGFIKFDNKEFEGFDLEQGKTLNNDQILTIVKIRIIGGRKHQIRSHFEYVLKTPIIFDEKYGFKKESVKNLDLDFEGINENTNEYCQNFVSFPLNKIFSENYTKEINEIEIENIYNNDYIGLHSLQLFLNSNKKISNFNDFVKENEEIKDEFIEIRTKLPLFMENLIFKAFKNNYHNIIKEIYCKRF